MPNLNNPRLAQLVNAEGRIDLNAKQKYETFATHAEAEAKAKTVANSANEDAVILKHEDGFQVVGIDELHALLPGGRFDGELVREAPIVSFVMTDPVSGQENIIGRQASVDVNTGSVDTPRHRPPTALDRYAERFQKDVGEILGADQQTTVKELNQLIYALEDNGITVSVDFNKDVLERKDSFSGLKNMLTYALNNREPLQQRSIREIAIVNEWDNIGGTRVDLEYDDKQSHRRLNIGDDFLDDWGGGLVDKSITKITDGLGDTLSDSEVIQRSEYFRSVREDLSNRFDAINHFQQQNTGSQAVDAGPFIAEMTSTLDRLENEVLPAAEALIKDFSIAQEREASQDYINTFKDTIKELNRQLGDLKSNQNNDPLELNARLEKLKLVLLKGAESMPDSRNHIGAYMSGLGNGSPPSTGLEYTRVMGAERATTASLRAGSSSPLQSKGVNASDIMLGLGFSHTLHSEHRAIDGMSAGVGVGFSRETPFFIGVSASNSWYLNDYNGLADQGSVVAGLHASVGTYSNVGGSIQVHKQLTQNIDFEGSGELSLWNQSLEAEAEFALNKDKSVYLTGGVGTNKLVYAGVGFADKYELEVGLGGVSLGKDSNNLPGESGWELGMRIVPLPLPYYRHHRVPGYQFTYEDKSTQYITPNGSFMTIKENAAGEKQRTAYIPDPASTDTPNRIVYRRVQQQSELEHLSDAPQREITLGPLGYLTVTEAGETLVDDGLIQKAMTAAELGIITDQAGVLWFDRMRPEGEHKSLGTRREELPLPLYRAVHR